MNPLAEAILEIHRKKVKPEPCFIGFDGFTDEIACAVDIRKDKDTFTSITSIKAFSERIAKASGKSTNIELVVREKKIGGNAPILASGLLAANHQVIFAGTVGEGEVEPLFKPLTDQCLKVFSLGPSSHSDCIEFSDGKLIFGKLYPLQSLSAEHTLQQIGESALFDALNDSKLFVSANWTMIPMMNDLWEAILTKIVPKLSKKERYLFVDFADPQKRTDADLEKGIELLKKFNQTFHVILGLNVAESERMAKIMNVGANGPELLQALQVSQVVIHSPLFASTTGSNFSHARETAHTSTPHIKTGAGDNFNAGYCSALLYGLTPEQALLLGIATSGFYVRKGKSPNLEELAFFLQTWHNNGL